MTNQWKRTDLPPWPLPKGRLNVRHRQMRGVWQAFAWSTYIPCASGDSPEEAVAELARLYCCPAGSMVKVNGTKEPHQLEVPHQ